MNKLLILLLLLGGHQAFSEVVCDRDCPCGYWMETTSCESTAMYCPSYVDELGNTIDTCENTVTCRCECKPCENTTEEDDPTAFNGFDFDALITQDDELGEILILEDLILEDED